MNQQETMQVVPRPMKLWLGTMTKGMNFEKWDADPNWKKTIGTILTVKCAPRDVEYVSKKLDIPKKTLGGHKVVDVNFASLIGVDKVGSKVWKVRFRETHKKAGGPSATSTKMQERGSAYIFEYALSNKPKNGNWRTSTLFHSDKKMLDGLEEVYPDVTGEWLDVFYAQHKVILDKFKGSQITKFNRDGGFMDYITNAIKPLGVAKKDNWNPADIWGVRGSSEAAIAKVKESLGDPVKPTQTIQQLNSVLRGMYKAKELVGISLKKTSGKEALWEEYNLEALTLKEVNDYKYNEIGITYNLKATAQTQALDSAIQLRQSGGGTEYNFQITSNDTSKPDQNLKFESKPVGSAKARGGKAEVKLVEQLLKDNGGGVFKNKHQNYPSSFNAWTTQNIDGKDIKTYKSMFTAIRNKITTDCKDADEFAQVIGLIFSGDKPWVAQSKLMQLTFLDRQFKVPANQYKEFWTDMLFLSIKKGDRFGPFAKLY